MGNKVSSMLQDDEIKLISDETGFTAAQIERLYSRFKSLDKSGICGSLSKQDFLSVPELAINPLCDRIVHMFFVDCDENHDRINFRQFMKVLATFRSSSASSSRPSAAGIGNSNHQYINNRIQSRKESIQSVLSPLTQNRYRHSRHSSCDGFLNYTPVQHHTTNQHSVYYVASTNNALSKTPSYNYISNNNGNNNNNNTNGNINNNNYNFGSGYFKKPFACGLLDPYEPANSRKQKLYFMFKIYDVDNDDRISLDDLKQILKIMVGKYITDTKLNDLAINTMNKVDKNGSGYIEFDEFCSEFLNQDIDETLKVKFAITTGRK